jgi:hypothetical protein
MNSQMVFTLQGSYSGNVISIENGILKQSAGRGNYHYHDISKLTRAPKVDEDIQITYRDGIGIVENIFKP